MGLLDKVKGKMVVVEDDGSQRRELEQQVAEMWTWLRTHLDKASLLYLQTGDPNHPEGSLQQCLAGRAYEKVVRQLDAMRAQGVIWRYENREQRGAQRIKVEDPVGNTYVLTEYFRDYSQLELWSSNDQMLDMRQADGSEHAIRATIMVDSGGYWITDVAVLGGSQQL